MPIAEQDVRRTPQQARSRRSVDAILDATAKLLLETDPGSVTMSAIGLGAGVSKAAIYRYYPDRCAVVRALALREIDATDLSITPESPATSKAEAEAQFRQVIGAYSQLFAKHPVMKAIWITGYTVADVGAVGIHLDSLLAQSLHEHFGAHLGADAEAKLATVVHLMRSAVELAELSDDADGALDQAASILTTGLFS